MMIFPLCLCKLVGPHTFVLVDVFQILLKMNSERLFLNSENIFAKIIIKDYAKLCLIVSVSYLENKC